MAEIEQFRYGHAGKLNKTITNDRSKPVLNTVKIGKNVRRSWSLSPLMRFNNFLLLQFVYESEKYIHNKDILNDIKKGVRLKHVRTNDRSKPFLRGLEKKSG